MKQSERTRTIHIEGVPVEIHKKKIRHVYIRVRSVDGRVTVSAPQSMDDRTVERFVRGKAAWIQKQAAKIGSRPRPEVESGALSVWGKRYALDAATGQKNALALAGDRAVWTAREAATPEQRARFLREWYRAQLKAEVPRRLRAWEAATGLKASGWQTKDMTTRWGTCNVKTGKIWLNVQLAKYAPECLDYVILHELIHLKERGHNARFYALMDRYMPSWRAVKAALNGRRPYAGA